MAFSDDVKLEAHIRASGQCECVDPFHGHSHYVYGDRCPNTENLEVHHIRPQAEGGSDTLGNSQVLCRTCHDFVHA